MKRLISFLIAILTFALLLGCSSEAKQKTSEPTADSDEELLAYLEEEVAAYFEARDQMILPFLEASERNDEAQMKSSIDNEILPFYESHLEDLQEIQPKTTEVQDLHQLLIEKETLMYESFELQGLAIGTANAMQLEELSRKYEQYQSAKIEYEERLASLQEKYNLKVPAD